MPPAELLLFLVFFFAKIVFFLFCFSFSAGKLKEKNLGVGLSLIKKVFSWSFQYHCAVLQM